MMKKNVTEKDVINKYEGLVRRQQALIDDMSNLGREKDYKVQKIEREYNYKIDNVTRELQAVSLQIETVKKYVDAIGDSPNPAVAQVTKTTKKREA